MTTVRAECISGVVFFQLVSGALTQAERRRRHWHTAAAMTAWSSLAHLVLLRCFRWLRSMMRYIGYAPYAVVNRLANLEATVAAKWTMAFFPQKLHRTASILMTSNVLHHYVVLCKQWWYFYNFSVTLNVIMNCARNYKICWTLSKLCLKY